MSEFGHYIVHPALGGWDSVTAPTLLQPDQLSIAENIEYDANTRKKRGGTTRLNGTQLTESGTAITFTNIADFWRHGTSRSPTQRTVAAAGTQIWSMTGGNGTWNSLLTGWGTNSAQTCITIGQGYAIFSNDNGTDAPQTWDQTTLAALGGTPPVFAISTYHLRRLFAAGIAATPSQATFSAAGAVATWSGADSSNLVFDEDDGDRIVGFSKPWRNRLYVFKGPNIGSVHEITGATFSGLARNKIISGAPAINHNSVITTPNTIYWASQYGFHELVATVKYGDTEENFLSAPIQTEFRNLNFTRTGQFFGFYHPWKNIVGWLCPQSGQTQNNVAFIYNYVQNKWAIWQFGGFNPSCAAAMRDPTTTQQLPRLYFGDYTGRVHSGDQTTLSDDDGTVAYTSRIRTPVYVKFPGIADEQDEKQFQSITTFFRPAGNYSATLDVVTDDRSQSTTVSMQGPGVVLGGATGFTLDTNTLGSNQLTFAETPFFERARSMELTYSLGGTNQNMEIYGYGFRLARGESSALEKR